MKQLGFILIFLFLMRAQIMGQNIPVVFEAESGILGSDFRNTDTLGVKVVTINTNVINTLNPGSAARIITFQVTFPDSGTYDLYARILVGPKNYDDDSFFYGNGLGSKEVTQDAAWIRANGLAAVGFTLPSTVVTGAGTAQGQVWKWLNLSKFTADVPPISFRVEKEALSQTFQIGAREDGLYFDKFAFGRKGLFFTVDNLDKGEPGSVDDPGIRKVNPIAKGKSKFMGCAWGYNQAAGFEDLWNQSTPENAGKWGSVESTRNSMNWAVLDSTYKVAKRFKMIFKQHTLIWGAQQPSWIGTLDTATQRKEIEQWFSLLATRYPDMEQIDVVNEPIHNAPNGMLPWGSTTKNVDYAKALGGAGKTGWDWIINSFKLARKYFPKSKLIMNEYSVINSSSTTKQYIDIIKLLQADSLIDGIGEQAHAFTTYGTSTSLMKTNLDALAATGLPIYLTEVDIDGPTDLAQLNEMKRVVSLFWEHPAVAGITFWGFRNGMWRSDQKAYLVSPQGVERPALKWLKAYIQDTLTPPQSVAVSAAGGANTIDTKGGTLQMAASVLPINATIKNITWSVSPSNRAKIDANGLLTAMADGTVTVMATAWDNTNIRGSVSVAISNQTLSTPKELASLINVYPNPSGDGWFMVSGTRNFTKLEVFGQTGYRILHMDNLNVSSERFYLDAPKGIYFLQLQDGNNKVRKKIAIQ